VIGQSAQPIVAQDTGTQVGRTKGDWSECSANCGTEFWWGGLRSEGAVIGGELRRLWHKIQMVEDRGYTDWSACSVNGRRVFR
jgi:hypothetical protein